MKRIETRNQCEIIRMAAIRIMGVCEKQLGDSDEEMDVWGEYDELTGKIITLANEIEHFESKHNKQVDAQG